MLDCLNPKILAVDNRVTLAESEAGIYRCSEIASSEPEILVNTNAARSYRHNCIKKEKSITYASGTISIAAALTVAATPANHASSCVARTMMALVLHRTDESLDSNASAKKAQANNHAGFPTSFQQAHGERKWIFKGPGTQITLIENHRDNPQKYPSLLHFLLAIYTFPRPWLFPSFWIANRKAAENRELRVWALWLVEFLKSGVLKAGPNGASRQ
jgi:hypothetical protein